MVVEQKKNAIIVSLHKDVDEIKLLAESIGFTIIETFIQHRDKPDVTTFIGLGKRDEINDFINDSEDAIETVIIDGKLKPSQWFLLEHYWHVSVYDRLRLILMIFRDRADRKEARLQVRLAELEYERPFVRELIHRSRSGEHPGLMAGGEYQVDDYYEMMKKQMKQIREKLSQIRKQRAIRRTHRYHSGYFLVSLAGYTNAGKSSLLNLLTEEDLIVEDRLFSTLSTTTRKLSQTNIPILVTDTVGFIQRLPAWIIEAFHSTLEEIKDADVVVLVIDGGDPFPLFQQKIQTSVDELNELGFENPVLIAINKIELISSEEISSRIDYVKGFCAGKHFDVIPISVINQENISLLIKKILSLLPQLYRLHLQLPNTNRIQSFLSWMHEYAEFEKINYTKEVDLIVITHEQIKDKIISQTSKLEGKVLSVHHLNEKT